MNIFAIPFVFIMQYYTKGANIMPFGKILGVHIPHRKNTAKMAAVKISSPDTVSIPMSMHIGAPAEPIVSVGDHVLVGQKIAEAGGFVSSPIHASISGTVKKIDGMLISNGQTVKAVTIESDGEMTPYRESERIEVSDFDSFISAVRESGIVGLGGAGFPTAVKLGVKDLSKLEHVVINGAECEPYITSDTRTMLDRTHDLAAGVELLKKYLGAKSIVFGIEKNKPECIACINELFENDPSVKVVPLPSSYPQGAEKVLVYNTTGKVIEEGKLPFDAGVIVINVTTLCAVAEYIETGMPLTSKCVTVDGSAVAEPKNVIAPIGTPIAELIKFCGGYRSEPKKILYGGPMMGISVYSDELPILKNTNAIIALDGKDAAEPKQTPCIHCGACVNHCPMRLDPPAIAKAYKLSDGAALEALKVNLCMECGVCSYICPAARPIVHTHKLAKVTLRNYQKAKESK